MKNALSAIKERDLDLVKRQIKLEENALQAAMERWKNERKDKFVTNLQRNVLKKSMWTWHEKLVPLIQEELGRCKNKEILLTGKYLNFFHLISNFIAKACLHFSFILEKIEN